MVGSLIRTFAKKKFFLLIVVAIVSYSSNAGQTTNGLSTLVPLASAQGPETITVTVADTDDEFEIQASMSNGLIANATLYREYNYLVFDLTTSQTEAGELTVVLPRALIDAKTQDLQSDDRFTIVLDDYEIDYTQTDSNENERTIVVAIGPEVLEATIVGTQVLPEFPIAVIGVVVAALCAVTIFARFGRLR